MGSASGSSSGMQTYSKNIPKLVSELLELTIFYFSYQFGLGLNHKNCGDSVFEGVSPPWKIDFLQQA